VTYQWWDLYWIVPVALIGLIVSRAIVYVLWSIPIWTLEAIQDGLRVWILRRETPGDHSADRG
jgi:hypothetical protein